MKILPCHLSYIGKKKIWLYWFSLTGNGMEAFTRSIPTKKCLIFLVNLKITTCIPWKKIIKYIPSIYFVKFEMKFLKVRIKTFSFSTPPPPKKNRSLDEKWPSIIMRKLHFTQTVAISKGNLEQKDLFFIG